MKKIISILFGLMMCFTFSSCITPLHAQVDGTYSYDDADINVIITYGTPFYNTDGLLLYYIYRDMYYYPYFYNNRYYFHRYSRPLPPNRMRRYRPVPRDFYTHSRPHNGNRPHTWHNHHTTPHRPTPNVGHHNGGFTPNTRHHGGFTPSTTRPPRQGGSFGNRGHFGSHRH